MTTTVWNPADKDATITLSNSNATAQAGTLAEAGVRSTSSKSAGLLYFEVQISSFAGTGFNIGVADATADLSLPLSDPAQVAWCLDGDGVLWDNGVAGATVTAPAGSDVVGVAVDFANGYVWFLLNNVLANGGSLPLDNTNFDFNTLTGTVFAALSTSASGPGATGYWEESQLLIGLPPGFDDWDEGAVLPETCVSNAAATEALQFDGSSYTVTITEAAAASETQVSVRTTTETITETAGSTDTDSNLHTTTQTATAAATEIVSTTEGTIDVATATANASATVSTYVTGTTIETAVATEAVTLVRGLTQISDAVATATATNTLTGAQTQSESVAATETVSQSVAAIQTEAIVATETVTTIRLATQVVAEIADATATLGAGAATVETVTSNAVAAAVMSAHLDAITTIVESIDADDTAMPPALLVPNLWVNPITGAASTWSGLPFNSMVEEGGIIYAAGPAGIYKMRAGDDAGTPIQSEVTWDLMDFKSPQRKRLGSLYAEGAALGPFTFRVTNTQGQFEYKTNKAVNGQARQYRAVAGRGLDTVYYRIGLFQTKWFALDRAMAEHELIARRV